MAYYKLTIFDYQPYVQQTMSGGGGGGPVAGVVPAACLQILKRNSFTELLQNYLYAEKITNDHNIITIQQQYQYS